MVDAAKNEPVDPMLAVKLDMFTVPGLPPGFAERLVAAAQMETSAAPPLPPLRRPLARRWLSGGITGLGALAVGMISISAAAMGYLGEPIRHAVREAPVIGKVIERVIPRAARAPKRAAAAKLAKPAAPKIEAAPSAAPIEAALPERWFSPMERRERARAIMADPEQRGAWIEAHPRAARRIIHREQMRRQRIEAGIAPGPEARMPLRAMPGPMRRERLERLRERRRERLEMRGMMGPPVGEAQP